MILQELVNYYNRKAADPDSGIAPLGWERKEIPFLIVINEDGGFVGVEDTREMVGKKKVAKTFLVPMGVKRSVGILPNLGWDNVEYVLGFPCKGKPERVEEQHKAFVEYLSRFARVRDVATTLRFLGNEDGMRALRANEIFAEALDSCSFVTFRIVGGSNTIMASKDFVEAYDVEIHKEATHPSLCLVSGVQDEIAVLHPAIKGVAGANTTGGNVVSFNFSAACSFGKEQGCNAPVGGRAAFAYATALNTLLGKDSRQKLRVGDATVVFWAEKDDSFESAFASFFEEPPKDNPDALVDSVRALYRSPQTGVCVLDDDKTRFFVLGLAPNSGQATTHFAVKQFFGDTRGQYVPQIDRYAPLYHCTTNMPPICTIVGETPWEWKARNEENSLLVASLHALGLRDAWFVEAPYCDHGRVMDAAVPYIRMMCLGMMIRDTKRRQP